MGTKYTCWIEAIRRVLDDAAMVQTAGGTEARAHALAKTKLEEAILWAEKAESIAAHG